MLSKVLSELYELTVKEAESMGKRRGTTEEGHSFEDVVSHTIHRMSKDVGFRSISARHTLELPTFSGIRHQFDCSFVLDDVIYLVECKRRKVSMKAQIHYFNSIVTDYVLGLKLRNENPMIKGVFLSTAELDDNSIAYATAYGLTVVDPAHPPLEYLIAKENNPDLRRALFALKEKVPSVSPLRNNRLFQEQTPMTLLREYEFLMSRVRNSSSG